VGLVIIMIGATVATLMTGNVTKALIPLALGLLSAFVAYHKGRCFRKSTMLAG